MRKSFFDCRVTFCNKSSAGASLNESYNNWTSIFWRPFLVVTLLSNNRRYTVTVVFYCCSFHLHGPFTYPFLVDPSLTPTYTAFHYQ